MNTRPHDTAHPLERLSEFHVGLTGLTKREEFAKAAMIGLLADPEDHEEQRLWFWTTLDGRPCDNVYTGQKKKTYTETCAQAVARLAVEQADALIEALNK